VPIERVILGRSATLTQRDGADSAAEDEPMKIGFRHQIEYSPKALDVGFEQRRRISQVKAGVDDAVIHHVAVGHRCEQRFLVA